MCAALNNQMANLDDNLQLKNYIWKNVISSCNSKQTAVCCLIKVNGKKLSLMDSI